MIIAIADFDSRHTQNESAKSSFLIFSHLTFQVASVGHIFFTKSISSLLGPPYQMSQSVIVYVSCFQSKYSSWQLKRGLEEWEEEKNVKCRGNKNMKRFFSFDGLLLDFFGISEWFVALSLQSYRRHSRKHVSSYTVPLLRKRIYFIPHSPFT